MNYESGPFGGGIDPCVDAVGCGAVTVRIGVEFGEDRDRTHPGAVPTVGRDLLHAVSAVCQSEQLLQAVETEGKVLVVCVYIYIDNIYSYEIDIKVF